MRRRKALCIGIATRARMKARTLAVVRGVHKPSPGEPEVWFTSVDALTDCLSDSTALRTELLRRVSRRSSASS